jgi:hypothetical protein
MSPKCLLSEVMEGLHQNTPSGGLRHTLTWHGWVTPHDAGELQEALT